MKIFITVYDLTNISIIIIKHATYMNTISQFPGPACPHVSIQIWVILLLYGLTFTYTMDLLPLAITIAAVAAIAVGKGYGT